MEKDGGVDRFGNPAPKFTKREAIIENRENYIVKLLADNGQMTVRGITEAIKSIPKSSKEYHSLKVKEIAWPTVNRYIDDLAKHDMIIINQEVKGRREKKCELSRYGLMLSWVNGRMDANHVLNAFLEESEVAKRFKEEVKEFKPALVESLSRECFYDWVYLVLHHILYYGPRQVVLEDFYEYASMIVEFQIYQNLIKTGKANSLTIEEQQHLIELFDEEIAALSQQIDEKRELKEKLLEELKKCQE